MKDANAKIDKEEMYRPTIGKESLHGDSNDNIIRNFGDGVTKNQIDHEMMERRHRTCTQDVRSYTGTDGDTGHNLDIVGVKLSTRRCFRY